MKATGKRVPPRFGPETRFEIKPAPAAPFRATQQTEFERLKNQLLREWLEAITEPHGNSHLRSAANEAAALAWITPYPLLLFPALFEEKANAALARSERQQDVVRRTKDLVIV